MNRQITETIGGKCGVPGFKDGPLGINRFNAPDSLGTRKLCDFFISKGVDILGNIFINDEGNNYLRMILSNGSFDDRARK